MIIRAIKNTQKHRFSQLKFSNLFNQSRFINLSTQKSQNSAKSKYDQIIKDAVNQHATLNYRSKIPIHTKLLLVLLASSTAMFIYVMSEYFKFRYSKIDKKRSIFIPIWFNSNLINNRYKFYNDLKYVDVEYFNYVKDNVDLKTFQDENINYALLEQLSKNQKIKEIFGLPLTVEILEADKFKIWVEIPSNVSGVQIDMGKEKESTSYNLKWIIKPLNFKSISDYSSGITFDKLETSNANIKTHENSSGKPYEYAEEGESCKNRNYSIKFENMVVIKDKDEQKLGLVKYLGIIDFNHLQINKGVKIIAIELNFDGINYKII
ncbi:unnamed protein product [Candida verbasci]|uniref:Uncharacterized protein n=1 Tax=Candida verbasci TaxID=1227364 RepID=A0A9W4TR26_9ASCO|nr:unnamed protein product [Candida verbasci]